MGLQKRNREKAMIHLLIIIILVLIGFIANSSEAKGLNVTKDTYKYQYGMVNVTYIYQTAAKYGIDPKLVLAIINVESSGCRFKVNKVSQDYGCMQVNIKNIKALKLDKHRLVSDDAYGIEQGIRILAGLRRFKHKEPELWICRYNVGTGRISGKRKQLCLKYAYNIQKELTLLNNNKVNNSNLIVALEIL